MIQTTAVQQTKIKTEIKLQINKALFEKGIITEEIRRKAEEVILKRAN
ncbi:MAG: hypothetical protein RSD23_00315 [Ruthenibacterium sp.]